MSQVKEFYDEFSEQQSRIGINHRHLSIQRWVENFGLRRDSVVLEVGCGVGTQTELLLRFLTIGHVTGIDISPRSIDIAKSRLSKYKNLRLFAGDIVDLDLEGLFDVILLPDVLEHIPIVQHSKLFQKLERLLSPSGFILIHIPDPDYLRWLKKNRSSELQIIDQDIDTIVLLKNLEDTSLKVEYLKSYNIFVEEPDYQVILLKKGTSKRLYPHKKIFLNDSLTRRIRRKVKYILRGNR